MGCKLIIRDPHWVYNGNMIAKLHLRNQSFGLGYSFTKTEVLFIKSAILLIVFIIRIEDEQSKWQCIPTLNLDHFGNSTRLAKEIQSLISHDFFYGSMDSMHVYMPRRVNGKDHHHLILISTKDGVSRFVSQYDQYHTNIMIIRCTCYYDKHMLMLFCWVCLHLYVKHKIMKLISCNGYFS